MPAGFASSNSRPGAEDIDSPSALLEWPVPMEVAQAGSKKRAIRTNAAGKALVRAGVLGGEAAASMRRGYVKRNSDHMCRYKPRKW
jgi:hypothetical protein